MGYRAPGGGGLPEPTMVSRLFLELFGTLKKLNRGLPDRLMRRHLLDSTPDSPLCARDPGSSSPGIVTQEVYGVNPADLAHSYGCHKSLNILLVERAGFLTMILH